jgi:hypothetical protein
MVSVEELLEEYALEATDVRWYLALTEAQSLMEYRDNVRDLVHHIWSGRLEEDLYQMEDRFLAGLQEKADQRRMDEHELREVMQEIRAARSGRSGM